MSLIVRPCPLVVLSTLGAALFVLLAAAMPSDFVQAGDLQILDWLRSGAPDHLTGPAWLGELALRIDRLGSPAAIGATALLLFLILVWRRRWRDALLIATAPIGALLIGQALKGALERDRPARAYRLVEAHGASFPSVQTLLATATLLAAAILVVRLTRDARLRRLALGLALLTAGLTGLGRVYLGAHWASDVLAAWALGAAWACACGLATSTPMARPRQ